MKFLVCISSVPDTTTKITFQDGKSLQSNGVQYIINPYDEIALTRALELKEALGGTVTVAHVGPIANEAVIRKALAIGADDAVRIDAEPDDAFFVAAELAAYINQNPFEVILTGRESIDFNSGQVGSILAELLGLPSVCVVKKLEIAGEQATLEREIDGGKEIISLPLPLVISAQKDLAEPRIPNMRGIMSARTKPLKVIPASTMEKFTQTGTFSTPAPKQQVKLVGPDNLDELVHLLHTEAKVI